MNSGIKETALASVDAAVQVSTLRRNNDAKNVKAVATGIVGGLVESAERLARSVIVAPASVDTSSVWSDMLEALAECDLTPAIYCSKSGRKLGEISPEPWQEYLAQIAHLGESDLGDTIRRQLLAAMIAQKAYTVAPVVLTTSGASLAMIRETSAADFIAVSLSELFPIPRHYQSPEIAARAEMLGEARHLLSALPDSALQYTCEVVTLYLSYIRPQTLPGAVSLLDIYADDLRVPFRTTATLGHFCGRIIQMFVELLARYKLRPIAKISAADLRGLRVHYQGHEPYRVLRLARREWRAAKASEAKRKDRQARAKLKRELFNNPNVLGYHNKRRLADIDPDLIANISDDMADAFDLSAVLTASGRPVPVVADNDDETAQALAKAAELRGIREQKLADDAERQELDAQLETLDIASLLVSGNLPMNFVTDVDDDELEYNLGLIDLPDFEDLIGTDDDDDLDMTPEDAIAAFIADEQTAALEKAMAEADAQPAKKRRTISLQAQDRATAVNQAAAALAFPSPKRRVIGAEPKVPQKPTPSGTPRRRIIS